MRGLGDDNIIEQNLPYPQSDGRREISKRFLVMPPPRLESGPVVAQLCCFATKIPGGMTLRGGVILNEVKNL